MTTSNEPKTDYLIASDFDKTLSFNDSGSVLCDILGIPDFEEKVNGLASTCLVHQGAELAYLLRHDPAFRCVRREHLIEAGKEVRLKNNVNRLAEMFSEKDRFPGARFPFYVISSGAADVVRSALEGIVPPNRVFGTEFLWNEDGEIASIQRVPAGYGKVAVLEELQSRLHISSDNTIYIGDGCSDFFVMQHVNSHDGHTIAVSGSKTIGRIAERTVLSDDALCVLVPILEDVLDWNPRQVRNFFATLGLSLQDWDKVQTDWVTFDELQNSSLAVGAALAGEACAG